MNKHYPRSEETIATLYNTKIRGSFTGHEKTSYLQNTCAIRMSYALLRSGFHLPRTTERGASMLGGDKKWYWLRVANLRAELSSRFRGFDAELHLDLIDASLKDDGHAIYPLYLARKAKAEAFLNTELASKNGIIAFVVDGWGTDATGHFTLWDGTTKRLAYAPMHDDPESKTYYPWLTEVRVDEKTGEKFMVQVKQIQFWELK